MAKISLRAYNRDIETVIEHGQIEEAIAHCKYILRFFPKHIETYRLLGKAYIESQRYSEAADILQRILSVLPDDFVAQIGMSIVREDEGNLDAALFHMEHAHEIQPSNGAVQDELRRLYGRRDGVEPPRLRLTRGALVRLYAKGDLYRQAIAEIRAALAEDPNRFDLEVILARMYSLLGQKVEATDVASRLVSKLPYCMEANRILAEILPTTSRAEDAKTYQQRIFTLDPYLAYISPNAPTVQQVPDNAVTLDRLEFQPPAPGEEQPAWAKDAGIALGGTEEVETIPDWLTPSSEREPSSETDRIGLPAFSKEQTENELPAISSEIPDWMQETGRAGSTQGIQENANTEEEAAAPAELPDWLKSMAPQEGPTPQSPDNEPKLDWLDQILPQNGAAAGIEFPFPGEEGLLTDNQDLTVVSQPSEGQVIESPGTTSYEDSLPPWLTFPEEETAATEQVSENIANKATSSIIETLSPEAEYAIELPSAIEENIAEPVPEAKVEPAPSESLAELAMPTGETEQVPPPALGEAISPATEVEQVPPESLAEMSSPTPEVENIPSEVVLEAPVAEANESIPSQEIMEPIIVPVEIAAEVQPDWNDLDAAMAWLEGLAAKQGADQETLSTPEDQRSETPPAWVTQELEKSQEGTQAAPVTSTLGEVQPVVFEIPSDKSVEEHVLELSSEPVAQTEVETPGSPEVEAFAKISTPVVDQSSLETLLPENIREMPTLEIEPPVAEPAILQTLVANTEPVEAPADFSSSPPAEATAIDQQTTAEKKTAPLKLPAEPASVEDMDDDAAFAWFESLAAKQGADEGTLSTSIEERQVPPPTWISEQVEAETKAQAISNTSKTTPAINEPVIQEQVTPQSEGQAISPEVTLPSELTALEVPALSQEAIQPIETGGWVREPEQPAEPQSVSEALPPVPTTLPEEEPLPSWLQEINQQHSGTRDPVAQESMDDLPDWLKGFESPSETQSTQTRDESVSISAWLQEQENPTPEKTESLVEVTEPVLSSEDKPEQPISAPITAIPIESRSFQGLSTSDNPLIAQAQTDLAAGKIDTALNSYNQVIEQGKNLDAVIQDLNDELYRHPVEISLWQTLGDALMRNDQIQEALDAYTKAEELLR